MAQIRASVFELIRATRSASLQGFNSSHRRRRLRVFVDSLRNEVGDFRHVPILFFRKNVGRVRGKFIVFIGRRRNAPSYLFTNTARWFSGANSQYYMVKVLTVRVFPVSRVTFGDDFRRSFFNGIVAIRVCVGCQVLGPIFFRSNGNGSFGRLFSPFVVNFGNASRRAFTRATQATRGVSASSTRWLVSRNDLICVGVSIFTSTTRDLCTSEMFRVLVCLIRSVTGVAGAGQFRPVLIRCFRFSPLVRGGFLVPTVCIPMGGRRGTVCSGNGQ